MANSQLFPEIISIVLHKYNSIDNKIYTTIMDSCSYKKYKGSYLIKTEDIKKVLLTHFVDDIQRISVTSKKALHKEANTIYFLNKILNEMRNLRWFQITLSKNATYNRINVEEESGVKTINFHFKVVRGSFRTFDLFKPDEIEYVNDILKKIGCIRNLQYSLVKLNSLSARLEKVATSTEDPITKKFCDRMLLHFEEWVEDDPEALIVTDYLDI